MRGIFHYHKLGKSSIFKLKGKGNGIDYHAASNEQKRLNHKKLEYANRWLSSLQILPQISDPCDFYFTQKLLDPAKPIHYGHERNLNELKF